MIRQQQKIEEGEHLTPAQWLPKPATSQLPNKDDALRAKWSPLLRRAEREGISTTLAEPVVLVAATV